MILNITAYSPPPKPTFYNDVSVRTMQIQWYNCTIRKQTHIFSLDHPAPSACYPGAQIFPPSAVDQYAAHSVDSKGHPMQSFANEMEAAMPRS